MTEPAKTDGPAPTPLERLTAKLRLAPEWGGRLISVSLLLAVSIAAAFAISPGLYGQQLPELRPEDVGKPFRSNSPSGFKASRDFEIVDRVMTEARRQDARAAVKPVYDLDPTVVGAVKGSVRAAFSRMRQLALQAEERAHADDEEQPHPSGKRHKGAPPVPTDDAVLDSALKDARQAFQDQLFGGSDAQIEDEDYRALVQVRFGPDVEQALLTLIDRGYAAPVASSRDELSREGKDGLTVRDVRDGNEHPLSAQAPTVLDVLESQAELDRFASIPGNLLPERNALVKRAVLRMAKRLIRPNLTINAAETGTRRRLAGEAVKDAVITLKKGQKVIGDGDLITENHLLVVNGMRAQTHQLDMLQLQLGGAGLVALLIAAAFAFHRAAFRGFRPTRKDAALLGVLLVGFLAALHLSVGVADAVHDKYGQLPSEALRACVPMAAGAMLVRFVLAEELALFFAIVLASLSGVLVGNSLSFAIYTLVGSLVASEQIARAKDRVGIFKAGVATGIANLLVALFVALAEGKGAGLDTWLTAAFAFAGTALLVPGVVMALTPLVESGFGYASDIKLLELANLNHPALKELIVQAPGTYHHSIILGTLVENAAEAIGANPLLARSCAYYHDIGKGRNPLYFGENQKGENRHDALAPAMSAVIIKRHVTEGLEMARQYRLPKKVADAIPQHHGTRLVGYFFHKAVKEQEGKENPQPVDESVYRYPGPKPQFKESALVMIADAVEASCRSLPEQTTAKLQAQVQKMINVIFSEGQLDECELTLKDLNLIARSFVHTLEGIYHARPEYPAGAVGGGRPGEVLRAAKPVLGDQKRAGNERS